MPNPFAQGGGITHEASIVERWNVPDPSQFPMGSVLRINFPATGTIAPVLSNQSVEPLVLGVVAPPEGAKLELGEGNIGVTTFGRAFVRVRGNIARGDYLMPSDTFPGIAVRHTVGNTAIGRALQLHSGVSEDLIIAIIRIPV